MNELENQLEFLELFGYEAEGFGGNRYFITDEIGRPIGDIEKIRIHKKNKEKNLPAEFAYEMEFDSELIRCKNSARLNSDCTEQYYSFDVKRGNDIDHVEMQIGEFPSLTIWSQEYGYMSFHINYENLFLNFKSRTKSFNVEETIVLGWKDNNTCTSFSHDITYCDKDKNIAESMSNVGKTTVSLAMNIDDSQEITNQARGEIRYWKNGQLKDTSYYISKGKLTKLIKKEKLAMKSFNHFRYILSKIFPIENDVLEYLLRNYDLPQAEIALFLPDIVKEKQKNVIRLTMIN